MTKTQTPDGLGAAKNTVSTAPLDKLRIIEAAVGLLNKDGIDQLSMRRLADSLGVRAASLYWHIKDKAELMQLLADRICELIALPDPNLPWQQQIGILGWNYRKVLLSVRDSDKILLDTPPATPMRFALIEAAYKMLAEAGFSPEEVVSAAALFNNYVLAFVSDEMRFASAASSQGKNIEEMLSEAQKTFSGSPEKYPTLAQLAEYATDPDLDKQFQFGLQVLLDGLTVRLKK